MPVCPYCRRGVKKEEYLTHVREHTSLTAKPSEHKMTPESIEDVKISASSPAGFMEKFFKHLPQKSSLSKSELIRKFRKALDRVKTPYRTIMAKRRRDIDIFLVEFGPDRNVTLGYNDLACNTFSPEELSVLLLHEACHLATLNDSTISIPANAFSNPEIQSFMIDIVEVYDEFLAHLEFTELFNKNKEAILYNQIKKRDFINYERIIEAVRLGSPFMSYLKALTTILNDAIYFYVVKDDSFKDWCENQHLQALWQFGLWAYEDCQSIHQLDLKRKETENKVQRNGVLSWSVDPSKILISNKIVFGPNTKNLHEQLKSGPDADLVERWEMRRVSLEGSY